ncbi:DinB family protein [bacterium]|nr:DinB family protein [bacterium]
MKNVLEQTLQIRKGFYQILKSTPEEELLKIPTGFNNNIWWNIAHVVVTQQLLVHKMSNVALSVSQDLVDKFKKGTTPDGTARAEEIDEVKKLLFSTVEGSIKDYENGVFQVFNEYTTSANVTLKNVDDAIAFNLFHEGLHLGSVFALQKAVKF